MGKHGIFFINMREKKSGTMKFDLFWLRAKNKNKEYLSGFVCAQTGFDFIKVDKIKFGTSSRATVVVEEKQE